MDLLSLPYVMNNIQYYASQLADVSTTASSGTFRRWRAHSTRIGADHQHQWQVPDRRESGRGGNKFGGTAT